MNDRQLCDLLDTQSPKAVLDEVRIVLDMASSDFDHRPVTSAFHTTVSLFKGRHPGFKACNTEYHNLEHTTDTFLAMARLFHGAQLNGEAFTERRINLGLITALFHDAGYIQEVRDREGTGAKYTANHEERGADLLERFGPDYGLSEEEIAEGRVMILCTDISTDLAMVTFPSAEMEFLSKMLSASDLMAQMAERAYLERLLFLYYEFKEANVGSYQSDLDLLQKTVRFYEFVAKRLESVLDKLDQFMTSHFASRWNIHTNLYQEAIQRQRDYLQRILNGPYSDPRDQLKRGGIVRGVREKHKKNV